MITRYALLSLFFTGTALAQGPLLPDRQEAYKDWYTVELIVFEQNAASRGVPPPNAIPPDVSGAVELEQIFARQAATVTPNPSPLPPASGFLPVPEGERQLTDVYQYLQRAGRFRPIVYMAWTQRLGPFGNMQAVHIHGGRVLDTYMPSVLDQETVGNDPGSAAWPQPVTIEEINGTAVFSMGNVPQLLLDLVFRTEPEFNPLRSAMQSEPSRHDPFNIWHLREHRAMQPGTVHYFDHRRFGVLAKVTPYQPDPAQLQAVDSPPAINR